MGCQCAFIAAGYAVFVYIAYKTLTVVYNIMYPYVFASPVDLKKKAGAKWAVVTGSTDGIGKAYAHELASRGFNIYLISRNESKLEETKNEISEKYNEVVEIKTFAFDFSVGSVEAYKPLFEAIDKVDVGILINNVGMSYEYPEVLHQVDGGLERIGSITTINTLPTTVLSAALLPQMVSRRSGIIVNISSSAGYNQMAMWAVYSATKKYVSWLSAILRKEYEHQGIIIQTICPMMVATKMSKIRKSSFFTPDGAKFAHSALNTVGNIAETSGFISHQLQVEIMNVVPNFILDPILSKFSAATRMAALKKKAKQQ